MADDISPRSESRPGARPKRRAIERRQLELTLPSKEVPPEVAGSLGVMLQRAAQRLKAHADRALAPLGISTRQVAVLCTLEHTGPLSQQALGGLLGVDRTTMVAIVDELEALRAVERRRDAKDRRLYALKVTARGSLMAHKGSAALATAESGALATLRAGDRDRLRRLLGRLGDD